MRRLTRKDAKAAGLKRYSTGKSCPHGHVAERFVSNCACIACLQAFAMTGRGKTTRRISGRKHDLKRQHTEKNKALKRMCSRKYRGTENGKSSARKHDRKHKAGPGRLAHLLRVRLWSAIRGKYKAGSAVRDLGCSIPEFVAYIESKFQPGWSWGNRGPVWHIDHIRPLAQFDLTNRHELLQAVHYTNLRPYPAELNIREGARKTPSRDPTCGD